MATVNQHKLSRWLDANPDAFNIMTMERIAQESGTSKSAVNRFLPKLVAARDGILPSEVMERQANLHTQANQSTQGVRAAR